MNQGGDMNISIELETYKELTAIMYPGVESYDEVIQDLIQRAKATVENQGNGIIRDVPESFFAYWYMGQWYSCDSGKDLLVSVLRRIARDGHGFLEKYAAEVNSEGRTRAYVARSKEELYPDNSCVIYIRQENIKCGFTK